MARRISVYAIWNGIADRAATVGEREIGERRESEEGNGRKEARNEWRA